MTTTDLTRTAQTLSVYKAEALRVVNGANLGDAISFAEELVHDVARRFDLGLVVQATPPFLIGADSEIGTPGADLHLDCCVTFMSGDGQTTECLVLVETDAEGDVSGIFVLPLAPLDTQTDYVLVGVNEEAALQRFAHVACVSFTRGTMITMATGAQRPVEDLRAGDLVVSPDHRLFIYQRQDHLGAGRSEVLVRARHLMNSTSIQRMSGGFVDYYQMLFDRHQIIYAEGIAAESMLMDSPTRAVLPAEMGEKLSGLLPGHRRSDHRDLEVQEALLSRPDVADLLRKSSGG